MIDLNLLIKENERLKQNLIRQRKVIQSMNKNYSASKLNDWQIEKLQTALVPINLRMLNRMNKVDVMTVIIMREEFMYSKIQEYEDSIKHNDRIVFRNQQEEITKLTNLLIDNEPLYKENIRLKQQIESSKCYCQRLRGKIQFMKEQKVTS